MSGGGEEAGFVFLAPLRPAGGARGGIAPTGQRKAAAISVCVPGAAGRSVAPATFTAPAEVLCIAAQAAADHLLYQRQQVCREMQETLCFHLHLHLSFPHSLCVLCQIPYPVHELLREAADITSAAAAGAARAGASAPPLPKRPAALPSIQASCGHLLQRRLGSRQRALVKVRARSSPVEHGHPHAAALSPEPGPPPAP